MSKKVVVTGANGFIGRNVVSYLKENGFYVIGFGRKIDCIAKCDEYFCKDIADSSVKDILIDDVFAVVHAAACLEKDDWNKNVFDANVIGTFNVINFAVVHNCKKFIYTSGLPIIGKPENLPISESHSVNPPTFYHVTKLIGEEFVRFLSHSGIQGIGLRIPSPVGKDMPCTTILPIFLKKALQNEKIELSGKGTRRQNYIDVRDITQAILTILEMQVESGIYNIGAKQTISNYELAKLCVEMTNSKSEICFNGKPDLTDDFDWNIDYSKAEKAFAFKPNYNVVDTIKSILEGWKEL